MMPLNSNSFESKDVKFPLKTQGRILHPGWDIPTRYAIDAINQCWMDNAHGFPLKKVSADTLIDMASDAGEDIQNNIRKILGIPEEQLNWQKIALANGWKPPEN